MYKVKYELSEPTLKTKRRMLETKFYIVYRDLIEEFDPIRMKEVTEVIASFYDTNVSELSIATGMLKRIGIKPTKKEQILCLRLMGMSYDKIRFLIGVDKRTITKYIKEYIDNEEPEMLPRLNPKLYPFIMQFLDTMESFFANPYERLTAFKDTSKMFD